MVKLGEIARVSAGQSAPKENSFSKVGIPFVRAGSLVKLLDGLDETNLELIENDTAIKLKLKTQNKGTILFAKSGMSCMKGHVYVLKNNAYAVSHLACVYPTKCDSSFLSYYFKYNQPNRLIKDESYPSISLIDIENIEIPLPPLDEQKRIAEELDKISGLIAKRKNQLEKLDLLVKAKFVEMFGDPVTNPMGWKEEKLGYISHVISGITKGRKTKEQELMEVPYMAVSNVKSGYIDTTNIKTILATKSEIQQYKLLEDDILMTEGGDPDKLGRGAIIKYPPLNCIHQNHIYRVRLDRKYVLPEYFSEYLQQPKSKQYCLWCAKQTTGIASINMTQLKGLPVVIPSINLQNQFAEYVTKVLQTKIKLQHGLEQLETLYKARMQEYFE